MNYKFKRRISIFDYFGGNFKGAPSELDGAISPFAKKLIDNAFENLNPDEIVDHHMHVAGLGVGTPCSDESEAVYLHPGRWSIFKPAWKINSHILMSAMGVRDMNNANHEFTERLLSLVTHFRGNGKFCLLAMDAYYEDDGTINLDKTDTMVPSGYVTELSGCLNKKLGVNRFIPVISVHPYRADALEALERFAAKGVRYVKWLPNTMNINPSGKRNIPYYEKMAELGMILLTHTGHEWALLTGPGKQKLGNPLLFRTALDAGVTMVMLHCARDGSNNDDDGRLKPNFELFLEMMRKPEYEGRLFGDITAMTIRGRNNLDYLTTIIEDESLNRRLVNGTDYPLPSINFLKITGKIASRGMITKDEQKALDQIYGYNPLVFDFVLKRTIRHPKNKRLRIPDSVFGSLESVMKLR